MRSPLIMGILNVTPDSFSDGGRFASAEDAAECGLQMMREGADWIDVGGESTRPGANPVSAQEEIDRVVPVITKLVARGARVSVDTMKASVAEAAIRAGATMVNDVTAFSDTQMAAVCANAKVEVCLMHMQGNPRTMQIDPKYVDVTKEVRYFLLERARSAIESGVSAKKIWIDPGIGFGKSTAHNIRLLKDLRQFVDSGYPVLLGTSRKSFIGRLLRSESDPAPIEERLEGTLATQALGQIAGVAMLRVHDVAEAARFRNVFSAITDAS